MARANTADEVFARLTEVGVIRDEGSPTSTTTDAALSEGDTTISVSSVSGLSAGDVIRVDTGLDLEMHEIESVDSTAVSVDIRAAIAYDHDSGVAVVTQTKDVLGDVTDDGITEDVTADMTDINVATQLRRYTRLINQVDGRLEFSVENINGDNLLFSAGMDDADVTGTGTADDPFVSVVNPDDVANKPLNDIAIYLEGILEGGDNVEVQGWNAEIDPNRSRTWNTGTGAAVPMAVDISALVMRTWS